MSSPSEFHIKVSDSEITAVDLLSIQLNLSKQKTKEIMQKGCVWLEGEQGGGQKIRRLRRAKKMLTKGMVLHCYYDLTILSMEPEPAALIADLGDYSVWNKPAGMLSQGSKWGDHCTLYRWAEKNLIPERTAFIVHRLDRAANGLMLLAHKKQTATAFGKMFQDRKVDKRYKVVIEGDFTSVISVGEQTTLAAPLDDREAISHVDLVAFSVDKKKSTLSVKIETGRKHQIRRHLADIGFAVVGDQLYGNAESLDALQLISEEIGFICPVNGEYRLFSLLNDQNDIVAGSIPALDTHEDDNIPDKNAENNSTQTSWDRFKKKKK